jgi:hypothetical protein
MKALMSQVLCFMENTSIFILAQLTFNFCNFCAFNTYAFHQALLIEDKRIGIVRQ